LVSLFSVSGFDAQAVHNGAEALAFIRSNAAVALILLDMSMPDVRRRSAAGHACPRRAPSPVRRPS
jgi:CheY-like chemotaxis protein